MDPPGYINNVFTAIEFRGESLLDNDFTSTVTQSLLVDESSFENDEGLIKNKKNNPRDPLLSKLLLVGILTGFFVHAIAFGAYALLVVHFGYERPTSRFELSGDWALYIALSILTQVDLLIYVLIWVAFTCTLSRSGLNMIRKQFSRDDLQRRYVFLLGVKFLVGIVFGAFLAWTLIDCYLGFIVPLLPITATVLIELLLCYLIALESVDRGIQLPSTLTYESSTER